MIIDIPRQEIQRFRQWLSNQPEYKALKSSYMPITEQEKVMEMLYQRYITASTKSSH